LLHLQEALLKVHSYIQLLLAVIICSLTKMIPRDPKRLVYFLLVFLLQIDIGV
jgi:hypothetical protein